VGRCADRADGVGTAILSARKARGGPPTDRLRGARRQLDVRSLREVMKALGPAGFVPRAKSSKPTPGKEEHPDRPAC
jgi:hypothetical protein